MAFRFFSRKKLFPGVTLNMSKSGPSLSFGPRGLKHTVGLGGRRRTTVGLPGTGLHYSIQHGKKSKRGSGSSRRTASAASQPEATPQDYRPDPGQAGAALDREFLRAVVAFQSGDKTGACALLAQLQGAADADWLRGIILLRDRNWPEAAAALRAALDNAAALGDITGRNGVSMEIALPLTPEVTAHIGPDPRATRLAYAEALQEQGDVGGALKELKALAREHPDDIVVALSLAEIAFEADDGRRMKMSDLATLLEGVHPESGLDWARHFYLARALERSDRFAEAIGAYDKALKDAAIPDDMALLARYEMALTYGESGDRTRCRQELSAIHAIDAGFADVEDRLRGRVA